MKDPAVRVEVVELDRSNTQNISRKNRATVPLDEQRGEIRAAIAQAAGIAQESLREFPEDPKWHVSQLEVSFGLTLATEASVIVAKGSVEASFEVTLTVERAR
ncbi:CU044_2847 family protein [Nonomuraea composti]|uniref:CU044_2847 family protein n=1 Tax=Nonomuraea composti TaxID=2720023 RepID=UPI00197D3384